jgi:hypothetical protein
MENVCNETPFPKLAVKVHVGLSQDSGPFLKFF